MMVFVGIRSSDDSSSPVTGLRHFCYSSCDSRAQQIQLRVDENEELAAGSSVAIVRLTYFKVSASFSSVDDMELSSLRKIMVRSNSRRKLVLSTSLPR